MTSPTRNALLISAAFTGAILLATLFTDYLIDHWISEPAVAQRWQTVKTLAVATVGGLTAFLVARHVLRARERMVSAIAADRTRESELGTGVTEYAIYLLDPEGLITSWNLGATRITGWQAAEILGKPFRTLFPQSDVSLREPERILKTAAAEGRFSDDRRLVRRDGETLWANTTITLLRHPDGSIRGYACVSRDVTAQRKAAAALADSERLFRVFFAQAAVGIAQFSPSGRILRVNRCFCDIVGRSEEILRRSRISGITHRENIESDTEMMRRCLEQGIDRYERETRFMRPDGRVVWVTLSMSLVRDNTHRPAYFIAVVADITARKEAEAAVEESRNRLAGIVETTRDAIITTDASLRIVRTNPAAREMFRRRDEEWLGHSLFTLFPPEHRKQIQEFMGSSERTLQLGGIRGITALRAGGEPFPVEGSILRIESGASPFFTAILRDNTERRRYEAAIAESGHRLQVAVEAAHLGFWDLDLDTLKLYVSEELKRLIGLKTRADTLDPRTSLRLIHPEDRSRIDQIREHIFDPEKGSAALELRVRHADGTYRDLSIHGVLLRDDAGNPTRILGTVLEMTPIREAERKVRHLSARILSLQDAERRRIARELHDTTAQNLAALNINLGRLRRALERERSGQIALVDDSVALADMSVQQIRTMSYLLHPPLLEDFGLERAARDYINGFAERSGIPTDLEIRGSVGRLPDEVELALFRVLQESLANVVRHSGCTRAEVRLGRDDDLVYLEVSDNGHGIDPETLKRLREQAPLGVGVSGMTERLAQIGGRLEINSDQNGTTVRATVAVEPDELHTDSPPSTTDALS